ncbi:MAG: rhamnosyl transferase related protein [Rhodobacteraceae bacterium PARR1]|nr:MAG: rhamnosyl transferase related protein [Rhodobacteraceae bacterium PARR1]
MSQTPPSSATTPRLGVVIVTYGAADVIADCLETLFASEDVTLSVVVVDNASPDRTEDVVRDWQAGRIAPAAMPFATGQTRRPAQVADAPQSTADHHLALIQTGANLGFAAAVNIGLSALSALPALDRFWVLNPDSAVPPATAAAFASHPAPEFGMIGGRVLYFDRPEVIQIDGGVIDWRTGVTRNVNQFGPADTPPPDAAAMDFITGASMVVSRDFLNRAGLMPEDYFLYYEEVDWALQRGDLPLVYCATGVVYHRAGSAIGSPAPGRKASPFSTYFKHRGRMRFLRRNRPAAVLGGWAFGLAKTGQLLLQGDRAAAMALLRGMAGAKPPAAVQARLPKTFVR